MLKSENLRDVLKIIQLNTDSTSRNSSQSHSVIQFRRHKVTSPSIQHPTSTYGPLFPLYQNTVSGSERSLHPQLCHSSGGNTCMWNWLPEGWTFQSPTRAAEEGILVSGLVTRRLPCKTGGQMLKKNRYTPFSHELLLEPLFHFQPPTS